MSIPHNCIGSPCLICNPRQTIFGTTPEKVIDCNLARPSAHAVEIARLRARVAKLEAVERAAREYRKVAQVAIAHPVAGPLWMEQETGLRLDAALSAAKEGDRG